MSVFHHKLRFGALLLGLVFLMTGCLGGLFSSPKPPPTSDPPTLLQGTVSGPLGITEGSIIAAAESNPHLTDFLLGLTSRFGGQSAFAAPASISGEAPLANVPVAVYALAEFLKAPDNAQVLQHGTTDKDGNYSLTGFPAGVDLIVVAATVPRLSAIVPAGGRNLTADMNSATALVAEAWAPTLRNENQPVSAAELTAAVEEARQALDALQLDADELLDALEELIPSTFGEGLSTTPPPAFEALVDMLRRSAPGYQDETYSVSGSVRDQHGVPQPNIEIVFSGGYTSVRTDSEGHWSNDGLEGDVTLSAQDADGFTVITPPLTVNGEEHNIEIVGYAGDVNEPFPAAGLYDVSGKVALADGTPLEGVKIEAKFASQDVLTDAAGEFVITGLDVVAVLVPEMDGYVFSPPERTVGRETHDIHIVATQVAAGEITFADPALEQAVREWLDLSTDEPITAEIAREVIHFSTTSFSVASLEGLEHFVNLEGLYVSGENLEDLAPLAALPNLQSVEVENSRVADLGPLSNKLHLRSVAIVGSNVSDVSPLATLAHLDSLTLWDSPISDVSALAGLDKMEVLSLSGLEIAELPSLQGMSELDWLFLRGNAHLSNIDALLDTTATWIALQDTPALDWCSWEATWSIVEALREDGRRVDTNMLCEGEYTLFGTVSTEAGVPYTPVAEVVLTGLTGSMDTWIAQTDASGRWEQTVEGTVNLTLRVKDEHSTVWRFTPAGRNHVTRPIGDLNFTAYPSDQPIIEGYVFDDYGEPLNVEKVRLIPQPWGTAIEVPVDENGYFVHEFASHGSYEVVPVSNIELYPSVPMPVSTPVRVQFTPTNVAPLELAIYSPVTAIPEAIVVGSTRTLGVLVNGTEPDVDAVVEWNIDGGTIIGTGSEPGQVEWQAPDTVGTVTASVHVTMGGRSGTAQLVITVSEPLTAFAEADRYVVNPGEQVSLTAIFTGYRADDVTPRWSADVGSLENAFSHEAQWTAPNYSGTFTVSLRGNASHWFDPIVWSNTFELEIEVLPDPLCEGAMNCGVIRTLDDLQAMQENLTARYVLANDIDATPTRDDWGNGFRPVGTLEEPFTGTFDGRGHTIHGLYTRHSRDGVGLFGVAGEGAIISDVNIIDADVRGSLPQFGGMAPTGILLGRSNGAVIENVHTTGKVTPDRVQGGGLVGYLTDGGIIKDSSSAAYIDGSNGGAVGGLVGYMDRGSTVQDSHATGDVVGRGMTGGLAGVITNDDTGVERTWSSGSVAGSGDDVGGLVGRLDNGGSVIDSYSTGDVEGEGDKVGGLVGYLYARVQIIDSYSEGDVFGAGRHVGGLVGYAWGNESRIERSWSNGDVVGEDDYVGGLVGANGGFIGFQNLGGATIVDSYSTGDVWGQGSVGGFVGRHTQGGIIESSWATGKVVGTGDRVGGFVGRMGQGFPSIVHSTASGDVTGKDYVGGFAGSIDVTSIIEDSSSSGQVYGTGERVGNFIGYDPANP